MTRLKEELGKKLMQMKSSDESKNLAPNSNEPILTDKDTDAARGVKNWSFEGENEEPMSLPISQISQQSDR